MENMYTIIWEYIRGDLPNTAFENQIYYDDSYKKYLGDELYLEAISNDYNNKDLTYKLKNNLLAFQRNNHPQNCKCIELSNLSIIDMGEESEQVFKTLKQVVARGAQYWWLYLSLCENCNQYWLIASEERQNDIFIMFRINEVQANQILNDSIWPSIFDKYEYLLKIGKEAGKSVRFFNPLDSSLCYTIEDLAIEQPGIKLSYLADLLNIDIDTALIIGKTIVKSKKVNIKLNE